MRGAAWNGFYLALGTGVIILFITPWIGLYAIDHAGHASEIAVLERQYFITLIPSGVFLCMISAFISFFNGLGRTHYAAVINITGCSINVLLDYVLIFGVWGFPEMGIQGAGIATSISCAFNFILVAIVFLGQKQSQYPTRTVRQFSRDEIRRLFRFGSPAALQCLSDVGAFATFAFLIGRLDQTAMVATTIILAINQMAFYPMNGLAESTAIITGQLMGANHSNLVYRVAQRTWKMATAYMLFMAVCYLLMPEWLLGQFSPNSKDELWEFFEVVRIGRILLICALIYNFFDTIKFVFMGALRGAGDTTACVVITTCCSWGVMVPGMIFMIFWLKIGVIGI